MRTKLIIGVLIVLCGVLGFAALRLYQDKRTANEAAPVAQADARQSDATRPAPEAPAPVPQPPARSVMPPTQAVARGAMDSAVHSNSPTGLMAASPQERPAIALPSTNAPEKTEASLGSSMGALARKMLAQPAMKEKMRKQMIAMMETEYGPLFAYLQLSEEDRKTLQSMLVDQSLAGAEESILMLEPDKLKSPEERNAVTEKIEKIHAEYDEKIRQFLGDEKYAIYKSYEETQAERSNVTELKGLLPAAEQLTAEQEDSLIRAMHEERIQLYGKKSMQMPDFSAAGMARETEKAAKLQEAVLARVEPIMTPNQLAQFKVQQKQQREMTEMAMKMGAQMFGKGGEGAVAAPPTGH